MPEGAALTYADLVSFPDDGLRRELIDGELIVSPSPRTRHQRVSARLHVLFANHIAVSGDGEIFYAPLDVVFSQTKPAIVEPGEGLTYDRLPGLTVDVATVLAR